jgi:hypothetical protein
VFDQFRTTWREFCTTPGAKFNEYRPTTAHELATGKRLVRTRWRKIRRISLHEKKEKNFAGAKVMCQSRFPLSFRRGKWPLQVMCIKQRRSKLWGGVLGAFT